MKQETEAKLCYANIKKVEVKMLRKAVKILSSLVSGAKSRMPIVADTKIARTTTFDILERLHGLGCVISKQKKTKNRGRPPVIYYITKKGVDFLKNGIEKIKEADE